MLNTIVLLATLLYAPLAIAAGAPQFNIREIIWNVVVLLGIGIIFGLLHYAIGAAPFLKDPWKAFLQWAVLLVGILIIIFIILGMIGL